MPNIAFFVKQLSPHIIRKNLQYPEISASVGISLFDDNTQDINDNSLYIGNVKDAPLLFSLLPENVKTTFFLSGDDASLPSYFDRPYNIISTDLPLIDLYSRINRIMRAYRNWNRVLIGAMREDKGIGHIVELAGQLLRGHILLFNPGNAPS